MPRPLYLFLLGLLLAGCREVPPGVTVVQGFELDRYLGRWYEIARLDHRFERGLSNVTADYSQGSDGSLSVLNQGYDRASGEWRRALGHARRLGAPGEGRLEVSFFGPFYSAYNVIALDRDGYGYAMVCGPSRDYLWILARRPGLDPQILQALIAQARGLGFPVERLIRVDHRLSPS